MYFFVLVSSDVNGYFIINFFLLILVFLVLSLSLDCLAPQQLGFSDYLHVLSLLGRLQCAEIGLCLVELLERGIIELLERGIVLAIALFSLILLIIDFNEVF